MGWLKKGIKKIKKSVKKIGGYAGVPVLSDYLQGKQREKEQRYKDRQINALAEQLKQAGDTAIKRLNPYAQAGSEGIGILQALLTGKRYNPETGETEDMSEQQRQDLMLLDPSYQFQQDEALKSIENSAAARGDLLGSRTLEDIRGRSQNIASMNYQQYLNNLMNLSNQGQTAATNQGNFGMNKAGNVANLSLNKFNNRYNPSDTMAGTSKAVNELQGAILSIMSGGGLSSLGGGQSSLGGGY